MLRVEFSTTENQVDLAILDAKREIVGFSVDVIYFKALLAGAPATDTDTKLSLKAIDCWQACHEALISIENTPDRDLAGCNRMAGCFDTILTK